MFADFFIKRPVFASVCALIIILVGAISIPTLPIERFPDISPRKSPLQPTITERALKLSKMPLPTS